MVISLCRGMVNAQLFPRRERTEGPMARAAGRLEDGLAPAPLHGMTVRRPCSASLGLDFAGAVYRVRLPVRRVGARSEPDTGGDAGDSGLGRNESNQ